MLLWGRAPLRNKWPFSPRANSSRSLTATNLNLQPRIQNIKGISYETKYQGHILRGRYWNFKMPVALNLAYIWKVVVLKGLGKRSRYLEKSISCLQGGICKPNLGYWILFVGVKARVKLHPLQLLSYIKLEWRIICFNDKSQLTSPPPRNVSKLF